MKIIEEKFGNILLEYTNIADDRGCFFIPFCMSEVKSLGIRFSGVEQLNHSYTKESGVVRGLNFQLEPFSQAKMIRCIRGSLYSVGVCIIPDSPEFGHWTGYVLNCKDCRIMYVPRGYAHGFVSMEPNTELEYFTDNLYDYDSAKSLDYADKELSIDWTLNGSIILKKELLSPKNRNGLSLLEIKHIGEKIFYEH